MREMLGRPVLRSPPEHVLEPPPNPEPLALRQPTPDPHIFAPPGHYYSPIVDVTEIAPFYRFPRPAQFQSIPGVDLDMAAMRTTWSRLLPILRAKTFPWKRDPAFRYFADNPWYGTGDAAILRGMLITRLPSKLVAVGTGVSSAVMLDTLLDEVGADTDITLIDPYLDNLDEVLRPSDRQRVTLQAKKAQELPDALFTDLGSSDILFIDTTHVLKTASDVAYLYNHALPLVKPGVLVHVHDIFYPFEYPPSWVVDENRSWNEAYILRAFLAFNDRFRIRFWNDAFALFERDLVEATYPGMLQNSGGSIWFERIC